MAINNKLLVDKRIQKSALSQGLLDRQEFAAYLAALPDLTDQVFEPGAEVETATHAEPVAFTGGGSAAPPVPGRSAASPSQHPPPPVPRASSQAPQPPPAAPTSQSSTPSQPPASASRPPMPYSGGDRG